MKHLKKLFVNSFIPLAIRNILQTKNAAKELNTLPAQNIAFFSVFK